MGLIDRQYTTRPFYGSRRMALWLEQQGEVVNRKRVRRLMRIMGLEAIYPKPRLSQAGQGHRIYPHLLRGVEIERRDQAWSTDITYIPMASGFIYLTTVIDWYSRYVIAWGLSNSLDGSSSLEVLEEALGRGKPEVFNTDQGVQFTAEVAELYRKRWTLETAFQELESSLNGEISTLGQPKAALFAFSPALVAYNVMSTMKAALRSAHGEKADDTKVLGHDLAEEVAGTHRGMMIAVLKDEWAVFHEMSPREIGPFLKKVASAVRLSEFRKQPRGPKRPRPKRQSGAKIKHVATSQLIEKAKIKPRPDQK